MSYNKQNFVNGQPLTAQQLNYMENGLVQLNAELDNVNTEITNIEDNYATKDFVRSEINNNALSIVNVTIEEVVEKKIIAFYIYDTKYEAEAGMTWAEWCNSAYNTYGIWVDEDDWVYTQHWEEVRYYDKSTQSMGDLVYGSDTILETKYVTYNP